MKCVYLIYTYLSTMFILTMQSGDPVTIFQPLKRETHFTKFDFQFKNKSSGTLYECSYKQIGLKQMLFFHVFVHEKLIQIHATFSVFKCHEFYVDCVNVISYEICDLCSKLQLLSHFMKFKNSKETLTACPILVSAIGKIFVVRHESFITGEYNYKNMTIEADTFGSIFGIPTENWFEYYWKINVLVLDSQKKEFGSSNIDLHFIQYRSRNRKNQKNKI